jgi:transposase-like protein
MPFEIDRDSCMSQHFLLSAKARTLSVRKVMEITDDQAFQLFKEVRWGESGEVACPDCATVGKHYFISTRKQWRCKDCKHTFSVTSGTIFDFHKLPLRVYLSALLSIPMPLKGCQRFN